MKLKAIALILLLTAYAPLVVGQESKAKSYLETRKLLAKMERSPANSELRRLFAEADARIQSGPEFFSERCLGSLERSHAHPFPSNVACVSVIAATSSACLM